jgi:hypothetical protein
MNIPKVFCMPDQFFKEVKQNQEVLYYQQCCSLFEFYRLLCVDTPGYNSSIKPPVGVKDKVTKPDHRAYRPTKAFHGFAQRPSDNTWGDKQEAMSTMQSSSAPVINPNRLSIEQIESAENAERRRNAPRRNAPIPEEDDSTGTEDEAALLFADKLLPSDKLKIKRLKKKIFRIKQHTQTQDYLWKRDKAIKAAEAERLAGGLGPVYLAGVKFPWMYV